MTTSSAANAAMDDCHHSHSKGHTAADFCAVNFFKASHHTPPYLFFSLVLHFSSLPSLMLHHHQRHHHRQSLSLSLAHPPSLGVLRNIQLYLLQLRILISPTRQNARAEQERRGAERVDLSNLPVCAASLTRSLPQLLRSGAWLCLQSALTHC